MKLGKYPFMSLNKSERDRVLREKIRQEAQSHLTSVRLQFMKDYQITLDNEKKGEHQKEILASSTLLTCSDSQESVVDESSLFV